MTASQHRPSADGSQTVMDADMERMAGSSDAATETATDVAANETVAPNEAAIVEKVDTNNYPKWEDDPHNPYNWPTWKKAMQMMMLCSMGFLASIATSMISPARVQLMTEFHVSSTVALLPLALYVLALGFGPVLGGPLSETIGRYPIYMCAIPLGTLFTLGAGFTHNFGALCFLRFLAGFCWGPVLSIASGSIFETFLPSSRGPVSAIFILMPFLGPGLGPVIGSFVVNRKDWRWTQWTLIFMAIFSMLFIPFTQETFHPIIKRRLAKSRGQHVAERPPMSTRLRVFAQVALVRPVLMLLTDPIVGFLSLYVAVNFGTLFSFFAAIPYTFGTVYRFSIEETGLVFLSIIIGCLIGFVTIILCDVLLYRKQIPHYAVNKVPSEYRLYPAMIGSIGPPIGLFWFAWTARADIPWESPAAAIIPFAWGNLCVFVSAIQYKTDTFHGGVVASAVSANSLARYGLAAAFPLFTIQMYEKLGIDWASSLLGFVSIALLPIPWILFKYGPTIRAKSKFETASYE